MVTCHVTERKTNISSRLLSCIVFPKCKFTMNQITRVVEVECGVWSW